MSSEGKYSYRQFQRFPQQLCNTTNIVDSFQVPHIHLGIFMYIDTDEIPGFFFLLKIISSSRAVDTISIFHVWEYWRRHGY